MSSTGTGTRPVPILLLLGALLLVLLQAAHFADVLDIKPFAGGGTYFIRANITPLAWCAYLIFLLGLLAWWERRSWLLSYRNRFLTCWLWSVPAWCYFDWMNFYFMRDPLTGKRAWEYINLPPAFGDRVVGYLLAFGAIAPGMFLTSEVLQRMGFKRIRTSPMRLSARGEKITVGAVFLLGLVLAPIPVIFGTPASNLAIWVGTWALLDPINLLCGRPSILRDWYQGRWGRTLALGAGGLICGLLWEFWNFWSVTKWVYHLPFLGRYEAYRYFEMPIPGLVGFIAFGIETWTMWQTSLLLLSPFVEGEQGDPEPADWGCF
jgi:hypothetical protein